MKTILPYILIAIFAGAMLPIQGSINAQLSSLLKHPLQTSLVSFMVGVIGVVFVLLILQPSLPSFSEIKQVPIHLYIGGFLGVVFVTTTFIMIPKIGAANMLAAAIAGQLIISVIIDHFGWFNVNQIQISLYRIIGVLLLLVGLYFIQKK